ncbi:MAG TPA: transporter [Terracidiphilus sp.]|nr:transporter [Terracidiphilus sp.]
MSVKVALLAVLTLTISTGASAQTSASFCSAHADKLYCLTPNLYANPNPDPFTAVLSTLGSQLGMVPLASPASGIIYSLDPSLKIPIPSGTETFGPVLVERGETLGAHKLFVAFTYQHFSFSSLDGLKLGKIPILFNVCDPLGQCAPIATNNQVSPKVNQYAFFGTYGVTPRIDVSVAVPIIDSELTVAASSCTQPYCQGPQYVNNGQVSQIVFQPISRQGSATGIGDVVLRGKVLVFRGEKFRAAAGVDVRLPSGDALNFQGTGAAGVKPFGAISRSGRIAPHVNAGFQWNGNSIIGSSTPGQNGKLPNNFFWDVGADAGATKYLTFAADVLGEYVNSALRLQPITITPPTSSVALTPVPVQSAAISRGSFPTLKGAFGVKVKPFGHFLISGNVLFSLTHNGLRNDPVPLVGASYTF